MFRRRAPRQPRVPVLVASAGLIASMLSVITGATVTAAAASQSRTVSQSPDPVSAQLAAAAQGSAVEVTSAETASSTTYANPDGTFTMDVGAGPVRAMTSNGWKPIDLSLVSDTNGRLSPAVAAHAASFSGDGSGVAARLNGKSSSLDLNWLDRLAAPVIDGSTATYALTGGMSLRLTAQPNGFEASIVLTKRPAGTASWSLPLSATGLTAATTADGGITLSDASGVQQFAIAPAHMWDATKDAAGDPAHMGDVTMAVTGKGTGQVLTLTPSSSFLSDPSTVYPVTIDPTFTTTDGVQRGDLYISSADPNTSYTGYRLISGYNGTSKFRAELNFDLPDLTGKHLIAANLLLHQYYANGCTAKTTTGYPETSDQWNTTWNNPPTVNTSSTYSATASFAKGGGSGCPGGTVSIDLTKMYAGSLSGLALHGVQLRGNETDTSSEKRFCSMNPDPTTVCPTLGGVEKGGDEPTLQVTYNTLPATPTGRSYNPPVGCLSGTSRPYVKSATPTFKATVTDGDGGTVQGSFYLGHVDGSGQVGTETLGTSVPAGSKSAFTVRARGA